MLSGVIAKKYGFDGLNEDSIVVNLKGTAGQSFKLFTKRGNINFRWRGNAIMWVAVGQADE